MTANSASKMYMFITMDFNITLVVIAQGVSCNIGFVDYFMYQPLANEFVQGAVDSHPIKDSGQFCRYFCLRHCKIPSAKDVEDRPSCHSRPDAMSFQAIVNIGSVHSLLLFLQQCCKNNNSNLYLQISSNIYCFEEK
jgi:hypothetical protein